eukprot:138417-Rhodomonas_salina.2
MSAVLCGHSSSVAPDPVRRARSTKTACRPSLFSPHCHRPALDHVLDARCRLTGICWSLMHCLLFCSTDFLPPRHHHPPPS